MGNRPRTRLPFRPSQGARWLASRRGPAVAVLLGVLASVPALRIGFFHDDLHHRLAIDRGEIFTLFEFTGRDARAAIEEGTLPWFTAPDFRMRFFRPLASASLAFDDAAFGRDALLAHAHSLVWFVLAASIVAALLRRLLRPALATASTAIYALASTHALTVGWLACRHALIGAALGLLALWLHVRWRQDRFFVGALIAPLALALALGAGEAALGALALIVAYEAIAERGAIARRAAAAVPTLAIGAAYLAFYAARGYGIEGSGTYVSPLRDPVAFIRAAAVRGPVLLGELYGAVPSDLWSVDPRLAPILALLGVCATSAAAAVVYLSRGLLRPHERRQLVWLGVGSIACLVPVAGGFIGGRLLPIATLGAAAVLGNAIVLGWLRGAQLPKIRRLALRGAVVALALLHFGIASVARIGLTLPIAAIAASEAQIAREADLDACRDGAAVYVINGSDPTIGLHARALLAFHAPEKIRRLARWRVLSMAPNEHVLRVGERSFSLELRGPRRATLYERNFRDRAMRAGERRAAGELRATVATVEAGWPTRLAFEADDPCFVAWTGRLVALEPARERTIPHVPGPMGL